jgi:hypothetical protein
MSIASNRKNHPEHAHGYAVFGKDYWTVWVHESCGERVVGAPEQPPDPTRWSTKDCDGTPFSRHVPGHWRRAEKDEVYDFLLQLEGPNFMFNTGYQILV